MKSNNELNQELENSMKNGKFFIVKITTKRCPIGKHKFKQPDGNWVQIDQYGNSKKMIFANKTSAQKQAEKYPNAQVVVYDGPISIAMGPFIC